MLSEKEIWVIGNYCHDTLLYPDRKLETLGGSSAYISNVFSALDLPYRVVSRVGHDFKYGDRVGRQAPIVDPSRLSTHFVDDYRSGPRVGRLLSECSPILAGDLPASRASIAILCGVAGEIRAETLVAARERSSVLLADAQGLIRRVTQDGSGKGGLVGNSRFDETSFAELLGKIDFIKLSERELAAIDVADARRRSCLLVTLGKQGARVIAKNDEFTVPAPVVDEIDSTGAGDCFLAGFAYSLWKGEPLEKAVTTGNRFGSVAVGTNGVPPAGLFLEAAV